MSKAPQPSTACLNCGRTMDDLFCPGCGQKRVSAPIRIAEWAGECFETLSSLDAKLPRTIIELTRGPGKMISRFVGGSRIPYTGPVRYAFLTCALWILAFAFFADSTKEFERSFADFGQLLNLIGGVPLVAIAIHLAFLRGRFTFAEHLCFTLFVTGHAFLWRSVLVVVGQLPGVQAAWVNAFDGILFFVYLTWALWQLHRPGTKPWALTARIFLAILGISVASTGLNKMFSMVTENPSAASATAAPGSTEVGEELLTPLEEGK